MTNAVKIPHAISAGMFGMIMPERNVPNFWTATESCFDVEVAAVDAVTNDSSVVPAAGCALLRLILVRDDAVGHREASIAYY